MVDCAVAIPTRPNAITTASRDETVRPYLIPILPCHDVMPVDASSFRATPRVPRGVCERRGAIGDRASCPPIK
ncbi:MAG: hypothetical protein DMD81_02885 [Candidatus Rokuibacteriota bacterium]|nr:MAG: hypothetical protein DMD81_02885 [Candidatus Rokubacteria bacterium]